MKGYLKFLFYEVFCPLLLILRFDRLLRSPNRKRLIVMYHGVCSGKSTINGRHLQLVQFEKQLRYFKRNFDVVSLSELCEMKLSGRNPERHTVALTFDDGYLNNLKNALPLLNDYQIPATFFVSGAALAQRDYIQPTDYLDLINKSIKGTIGIGGESFRKGRFHLLPTSKKWPNVYEYLNTFSLVRWKEVMRKLRSTFPPEAVTKGVDDQLYKTMNAEDLIQVHRSPGVSVGSHGHLHVNYSRLSPDEVVRELAASADGFARIGIPVNALAFPYGQFDDRVISICQRQGYRYLIAGGAVDAKHQNSVFPRIGVLNLASFSYNILSINKGFRRFGF